jgi:hypothetical protein
MWLYFVLFGPLFRVIFDWFLAQGLRSSAFLLRPRTRALDSHIAPRLQDSIPVRLGLKTTISKSVPYTHPACRIQHLSASGARESLSGSPTTAAAAGGGGGGGSTQNLVYPERPLSSVEGLGERLELVPAGTAHGRHALLHLHIGNDYSGPATIAPGKVRDSVSFIGGGGGESDAQQAVIHSWTLFVRARDDTSLSRWVKSVSFELKAFKAGQVRCDFCRVPV